MSDFYKLQYCESGIKFIFLEVAMKKTRKILVACLVFAFLCMNMLMYCVLDTPIAEA